MLLTPETINTIIVMIVTALGGLIAAWGVSIKRRAQTHAAVAVEQAQASAESIKTEAAVKVREAEARIKELEADSDLRAMMRDQLKLNEQLRQTQQAQFKQYMQALKQQRLNAASGYRTVRDVQNDTNTLITNMVNALKEMKSALEAHQREVLTAVKDIPTQMQAGNREELAAFAKVVGGELAVAFAEQLSLQQLSSDLFPFPDAEDQRWETAFIKPREGVTATLQKQPFYKKDVFLNGPCAQIEPLGESVRLIRGHLKGWLIIKKKTGAVNGGCWGWLAENRVMIITPPEVPVSADVMEMLP